VASQIAEVIDLKLYRERKAAKRLADQAAVAGGADFGHGRVSQSAFAVPVAFFVFWPTWVFMPHGPVLHKDGSGVA
jgi:hypothetical protein